MLKLEASIPATAKLCPMLPKAAELIHNRSSQWQPGIKSLLRQVLCHKTIIRLQTELVTCMLHEGNTVSYAMPLGVFDYTQFWSFRNWYTVGCRSITEIPDPEVSESNFADSKLNVEFRILTPELSRFELREAHTCKNSHDNVNYESMSATHTSSLL